MECPGIEPGLRLLSTTERVMLPPSLTTLPGSGVICLDLGSDGLFRSLKRSDLNGPIKYRNSSRGIFQSYMRRVSPLKSWIQRFKGLTRDAHKSNDLIRPETIQNRVTLHLTSARLTPQVAATRAPER